MYEPKCNINESRINLDNEKDFYKTIEDCSDLEVDI